MHACMTAILLAAFLGGPTEDVRPMQGKWKITAIFENGQSLSEREIATQVFADGTMTIDGPIISFQSIGAFEPKKLAFTINPQVEPKTIDLVGATRAGSKGIYMVNGDSLMVCFPGANQNVRPRDFGAGQGTGQILLVFKRYSGKQNPTINFGPDPTKPLPPLPQPPKVGDEMRKALIGTWGHQTDESINYYTLNEDGTFSGIIEWKKVLKKTFNDSVRSSGTWKLENGVVVVTVATSTEANMRNQIFSWRITNLGTSDMIAVDGQGRLRHEWRVR